MECHQLFYKSEKNQERTTTTTKKTVLFWKKSKKEIRSSGSRQQRSVQRCMLQRRNHCFHPRLTNYIDANCLSLACVFVDLGLTIGTIASFQTHGMQKALEEKPSINFWLATTLRRCGDAIWWKFGKKQSYTHGFCQRNLGASKLDAKSIIVSRPFN